MADQARAAQSHHSTNAPQGKPIAPSAADDVPPLGRSAAVGATIGFLLIGSIVTIAGFVGGWGAGSALGVGAFVGAWGGAGFGFMTGAILPLARHLDAQPAPGQRVRTRPATELP